MEAIVFEAEVASEIDLRSCLTISSCHPNNNQMIKAMKANIVNDKYDKGDKYKKYNFSRWIFACEKL